MREDGKGSGKAEERERERDREIERISTLVYKNYTTKQSIPAEKEVYLQIQSK